MCFLCSMTQTFDPARHPGEGPVAQRLTETTDAAASTDTAYTMSVEDTFSGSLDSAGDRDWVAISLTAGDTYLISVAGSGGGTTLFDPYLRLYDSSGSLVTGNDDSGLISRDSQLTFTASASGTYYISAGSAWDRYAGTYTIGVTEGRRVLTVPAPVGTLDELADFLTDGHWGGRQHTFDTSSSNAITVNLAGLTADGRQLARWAMEAWELVADIEFVEVTSGEMITMEDKARGAFASYSSSGSTTTKAYVNVGTDWLGRHGTSIDSYSFQTYIHELGHALGLGHQGAYNARAIYGVDETFSNDSWQLSIMSYFNQSENTRTDASYATLPGPMMADILAIQNLYGASDVTNGATTWGVGSNLPGYLGDFFNDALSNSEYRGGPVAFTIFDNGGVDHINASNSMTDDRWDMREQHFSDVNGLIGNVGIAAGTAIEHLTGGSGNDTITGNDLDNRINGGAGFDQARFGVAIGDFTVTKDGAVYTIVSAEGTDTVRNVEEFVFGDTTLSAAQMDAVAGTADQVLVGTDGDDRIYSGYGNDDIRSGDGSDWVFSGDGHDSILSGDDNDTIFGGRGNDSLDGGAGFDQARFSAAAFRDFTVTKDGAVYTIVSAEGTDTVRNVEEFVFDDTTLSAAQMDAVAGTADQVLVGTDGDDRIYSGYGNDDIRSGDGNNWIFSGDGNDTIISGDGNDTIISGDGNDSIRSGDGNNSITSGDGDDSIWSGDDNDTINSGDGDDSLDGGAGTDQARFRVADSDFVVIKDGAVYTVVSAEGIDTVTNVEEFVFGDTTLSAAEMDELAATTARELLQLGGAGDDDLTGTDGADTIHGGDGDNTIRPGNGNNWIWSGDGDDTIISGNGNNWIWSGDGDDTISSGYGNDTINSGDGDDTINSWIGNNSITSGDGDDTIRSGRGNDTIISGDGDDSLDAGAGFDQARFGVAIGDFTVTKDGAVYTIVSAEGTDTVRNVEEFVFDDATLSAAQMDAVAGTADQVLVGTDGDDTITSGAGDDDIRPGDGNNRIISGYGNDTIISGDDNDTIISGYGNDTISSGAGDDSINSGYGNDTISSGDGDDSINSGDGDDTINSGDDNDSLDGGAGNDSLDGGVGFDQARFGAAYGDFDVTKTVTQDGDVYTIVSAEGTDTVRNVEEFVFGDTTLSAAQMDALRDRRPDTGRQRRR